MVDENSGDDFVDILKLFAPGTAMRNALDDIVGSGMGAIVVFEKEGIHTAMEGGFKVNCKFTPQKLFELAKMDGAIIVTSDLKKILYSNVLLTPKAGIFTKETGTRHKAAERTAKQLKTIVVAVSERKKKISIYWKDEKHVLEASSEILRRVSEHMQILEKEKEDLDQSLSKLNVLEIKNKVTSIAVCNVLQRIEIFRRVAEVIRRYLAELGKEGIIVSMRLQELGKNVFSEKESIIGDYFPIRNQEIETMLERMDFDFLLDPSNISRMLFEELHDANVSPRGLRILRKTNVLDKDLLMLVAHFSSLDFIFNSSRDALVDLLKNEDLVDSLMKELDYLKKKILSGERI